MSDVREYKSKYAVFSRHFAYATINYQPLTNNQLPVFIESYFQTATHIFEQYQLQMPLHLFLKEYFRSNKKFGSRDRKYIAELLFGLYRLGKSNEHISVKDRFIIGSFLSNRLPKLFFEKVNQTLASMYELSFEDKKEFLIKEYQCNFSLPFKLNEGINEDAYIHYVYAQPRVFIRIRQHRNKIREALQKHKIKYEELNENCFSFDSNIKLNEYLDDKDYVIQDYASQQTGHYFSPSIHQQWWDCCCASGGKSIMLLDKNSDIQLTVTDIRESILKNLHERMRQYGYASHYVSHTVDVSKNVSTVIKHTFDAIICDAPCSGSGTWARSPEQFYFFSEDKLQQFTEMQTAIVSNVMQSLKQHGKLFYITCSVFEKENEFVLECLRNSMEISVTDTCLIQGERHGGDMMYMSTITYNNK